MVCRGCRGQCRGQCRGCVDVLCRGVEAGAQAPAERALSRMVYGVVVVESVAVFNIYREVSFSVIKLGAEINQNWYMYCNRYTTQVVYPLLRLPWPLQNES